MLNNNILRMGDKPFNAQVWKAEYAPDPFNPVGVRFNLELIPSPASLAEVKGVEAADITEADRWEFRLLIGGKVEAPRDMPSARIEVVDEGTRIVPRPAEAGINPSTAGAVMILALNGVASNEPPTANLGEAGFTGMQIQVAQVANPPVADGGREWVQTYILGGADAPFENLPSDYMPPSAQAGTGMFAQKQAENAASVARMSF